MYTFQHTTTPAKGIADQRPASDHHAERKGYAFEDNRAITQQIKAGVQLNTGMIGEIVQQKKDPDNSNSSCEVIQLMKGVLRRNYQTQNFFVQRKEGGQFIRYYVAGNNIGQFQVNDKVHFDLNAQNRAINLRRIERSYIIPGVQGTGMSSVLLGVKRTHYNDDPESPIFAGGMPATFGGDKEGNENDQQAVERELHEETGFDVGENHPVLTQEHAQATKARGAFTLEHSSFFSAPDVIPPDFNLAHATPEMQRAFILHLDDITADLNNRLAVMLQICQIAGVHIADPHNLTPNQAAFRDSATLTAMIQVLRNHQAEQQ